MHDDDILPSRQQTEYEGLADSILGHLKEQSKLLPAMKLEEAKMFLELCRDAKWFSQAAASHDHAIKVDLSKNAFTD